MRLSKDIIRFLNERPFTVLFSGGKDSLASLLWVLDNVRHDRWNILYIEITGNTHPLCNEYVHHICEELGVASKLIHVKRDADFFDYLRRYGIPLIGKYRWCLWQFKIKVMSPHSYVTQVSGIKRSDSHRRRNINMVEYFRLGGYVTVNPLIEWTDDDVMDYIRGHGIQINPCYRIYGHSGNCMFCPYHSRYKIIRTLQDPYWRSKIIPALRECRAPRSAKMREIRDLWLRMAKQTSLMRYLQ